MLLESECFLRYGYILAHILLPSFILKLNLVLFENSQESLKIDSNVFIAPELVHKVVEFPLIDFQWCALKQVSEIFLSYESSAPFVCNWEKLCSVLNITAWHCFDKLVDDLLIPSLVLNSKSFQFGAKFRHANGIIWVYIQWFPKDIHLVLR